MTANPIDLIGGLTTTSNVVKADLTAWGKARVPQLMADPTEIRNTVLAAQLAVTLKSTGETFFLDAADTTTADDGVTCIVSSDGKRFKELAAHFLNVQQAISFTGDITPAQITANQNDYAPTGFSTASILRLSTDASRTVTGLAGGTDGRTIFLYNVGAQNLTLASQSASSSAANRFVFVADETLAPNQGILLQYDVTTARWRGMGVDVIMPASSTDKTAARYSGTTGQVLQGSALVVADTTAALSRSGGGGIAVEGLTTSPAPAGSIGQIVAGANTGTFASPFVLTVANGGKSGTGAVWNTIALPSAGFWKIYGNAGVCHTGANTPVFSHMHNDHNITGLTAIQTSPGGGSTVALHVTSNDPNGWIFPVGGLTYYVSGATTVNFVMTVDYSTADGTAGAYGNVFAIREA